MDNLGAVQSFGEALKKNVQCPICLGFLKNPASGECLHKFCKVCIDQQVKIRKKPKCPICNKPLSRRSIRVNGPLKSVLRGVESILLTINEDGVGQMKNDNPVVPFSQFDISRTEEPTEKQTSNKPPTAILETPLIPPRKPTSMVVETPARSWSSNRKRKKTTETQPSSPNNENEVSDSNRQLLEKIENSSLGNTARSSRSSRRTIEGGDSMVTGKENNEPIIKQKYGESVKQRMMEKLLKNAREIEASGKVSDMSLNSTSYKSPKPSSLSVSSKKKVSPFVLKPGPVGSPSVLKNKAESPLNEDITLQKRILKKKEIPISSDEEAEPVSHSSGKRLSLRRRASRPPIIEDDDEEEGETHPKPMDVQDRDEPNTLDHLGTSFGLKGPSEVFQDGPVTIKNSVTKSRKSESQDVMKIGKKVDDNQPTETETQDDQASLEILENLNEVDDEEDDEEDDDLPLCGIEEEVQPSQPKKVAKTPKLSLLKRDNSFSVLNPTTPLLGDVIKSTSTVLETPMISNPKYKTCFETPNLRNKDEDLHDSTPKSALTEKDIPKESRKRSIDLVNESEEKCYGKKSRYSNSPSEKPSTINAFISKVGESQKKSMGPKTPLLRKTPVVDVISLPPQKKTSPKLSINKDGDMINYTIQKENPSTRLTIVQEGQGKMLSSKMFQQICEDVLENSDADSLELVDSLDNNNMDFDSVELFGVHPNPIKADHTALIFGNKDSEQQEDEPDERENERESKTDHETDHEPDSLEGFTYTHNEISESDFKKTFGILQEPPSPDHDDILVADSEVNVGGEVKLSEVSQQLKCIKDSQPVETVRVFDVVPEKASPEGKLELASSTPVGRVADSVTSPVTPNQTMNTTDGHLYTTQEIAQIENELKENERALLRLQEIENAGIAIENSLDITEIVKQKQNTPSSKVNETIVKENEEFTQDELFGNSARSPGRPEVNTAELIEQNEAAIEGIVASGESDTDKTILECSVTSHTKMLVEDSVTSQTEMLAEDSVMPHTKMLAEDSVTSQTEMLAEVDLGVSEHLEGTEDDNLEESKEKEKLREDYNKEVEVIEDKAPGPGSMKPAVPDHQVLCCSSISSSIPPTQERSPIVVCKRLSGQHRVDKVRHVNILMSGRLGRSGTKDAFALKKYTRDSSKVQFRILTQYSDIVTHLVVPHVDTMLVSLTTKYLRGLAGGKWIVSNEWLAQSFKAKELLNEAPYEMQGDTANGRTGAPRAARMARALKQPPLFNNLSVYFSGSIEMINKPDFSQLLEAIGINIVPAPSSNVIGVSQPSTYKTQSRIVPLIDSSSSGSEQITKSFEDADVRPLTAQWVITCLCCYKVIPPEEMDSE